MWLNSENYGGFCLLLYNILINNKFVMSVGDVEK